MKIKKKTILKINNIKKNLKKINNPKKKNIYKIEKWMILIY